MYKKSGKCRIITQRVKYTKNVCVRETLYGGSHDCKFDIYLHVGFSTLRAWYLFSDEWHSGSKGVNIGTGCLVLLFV